MAKQEIRGLHLNLEVFDVRDHYDKVLVERFYNEVMKVAFPMEDELDPIEVLQECVSTVAPPNESTLHIMMAIEKEEKLEELSKANIAGGIVFEYYPLSHSGLISYVVTAEAWRGKGIGKILMNHVLAKLNLRTASASFPCLTTLETHFKKRNFTTFFEHLPAPQPARPQQAEAKEGKTGPVSRAATPAPFMPAISYTPALIEALGCGCGGGAGGSGRGGGGNQRLGDGCGGCGGGGTLESCIVFAETNKLGVVDGVLDPSVRHSILRSYGLRHLKMPYVQPALTDEQEPCFDLLLLGLTQDGGGSSLPAARIALFLEEYFSGTLDVGDHRRPHVWREATYNDVLQALKLAKTIPMVHEGPWEDVTLSHMLPAEASA